MKKAAEALGMSQQQLQEMAKQLEEMEALDGAMADLQDAKNGMPADGMNQLGDDLNSLGMDMGHRMGNGQNGSRPGRGQGDRPEAPDDTATYKTKVQQQIGKGKAVLQGFTTPGKTVKGETSRSTSRASSTPPPATTPTPSPTRRSPRTSRSTSGRTTTSSTRGAEAAAGASSDQRPGPGRIGPARQSLTAPS